MADKHEVVFQWPHPEPNTVIVTGTFDDWEKVIYLTKGPAGFHGSTRIPWNERIAYKFIVDGEWKLLEGQPTEPDRDGNVNNIYTAPPPPFLPPGVFDVIPTVAKHANENTSTGVTGTTANLPRPEPTSPSLDDTMAATSNGKDAPALTVVPNPEPAVAPLGASTTTDIAGDVPEQGAELAVIPKPESAVAPVAEGETDNVDTLANGAPEQPELAVIPKPESAVAPIVEDNEADLSTDKPASVNADENPTSKPRPDDEHDISRGQASSLPEPAPSPVAPDVPISIVPVNAAENNTSPRETQPLATQPSGVESETPVVEPTQSPNTTTDAAPSDEPIPSTHGVIASESAAPVVGEIGSRTTEPSPAPEVSPADTTTAPPELEAVPILTSNEGLNTKASAFVEIKEPTSMDSHTPETVADPVGHDIGQPQENDAHKDSEPVAPIPEPHPSTIDDSATTQTTSVEDSATEEPATVSSHIADEASPQLPGSTEKSAAVPPQVANGIMEQPTVVPSHVAEKTTDSGLKPTPIADTTGPNAPIVSVGDVKHTSKDEVQTSTPAQAIEDPTSEPPKPTENGVPVEDVSASVVPVVQGNGVSTETASTTPADTKAEPSSAVAPTEAAPQPTVEPVSEKVNGSAPVVETEKPTTNGHSTTTATPAAVEEKKSEAPAPPTTPTKASKHSFPSSGSPSSSPSSSKFNTTGSRKKRTSFIAKVKHLFSHDKEKEEKK